MVLKNIYSTHTLRQTLRAKPFKIRTTLFWIKSLVLLLNLWVDQNFSYYTLNVSVLSPAESVHSFCILEMENNILDQHMTTCSTPAPQNHPPQQRLGIVHQPLQQHATALAPPPFQSSLQRPIPHTTTLPIPTSQPFSVPLFLRQTCQSNSWGWPSALTIQHK